LVTTAALLSHIKFIFNGLKISDTEAMYQGQEVNFPGKARFER